MRGLLINYLHRRRAQKRGRQFEITLAGDEQPSGDAMRQVSERTVQRDWRKARLLLQHALLADGEAAPDEGA